MARRVKRAKGASAAIKAARSKPKKAAPEKAKALPAAVTVAQQFEFYGAGGALHRWPEGAVVTDPVQIAMLVDRLAPLKDEPECQASHKMA